MKQNVSPPPPQHAPSPYIPDTALAILKKFPWHDFDGFCLELRGQPNTPLTTLFNREIYDLCLRSLPSSKSPGPDEIPNEVIKTLLPEHHDALYQLFTFLYHHKRIPSHWKHSESVLLHKKEITTLMPSLRPVSLANTVYKLFASTLTKILTSYSENFQILNPLQEGF